MVVAQAVMLGLDRDELLADAALLVRRGDELEDLTRTDRSLLAAGLALDLVNAALDLVRGAPERSLSAQVAPDRVDVGNLQGAGVRPDPLRRGDDAVPRPAFAAL